MLSQHTAAERLAECCAIVRGEGDAFGRRFNSLPTSKRRRLLYLAGVDARIRYACRGVWFSDRSVLWADLSEFQRAAVRLMVRDLADLAGVLS
jgi:hypothetical protein